uniref:Nuclear receptor domain-containing protein n=1 Tax=Heterorhabditis bacteriophora TaxID=37862 RepID=A0A1I7X3Q8_HETBA
MVMTGFPFHDFDYRIPDGIAQLTPQTSTVEHTVAPPAVIVQHSDITKDMPELKHFAHFTPRGRCEPDIILNSSMFPYHMPSFDMSHLAIKKELKVCIFPLFIISSEDNFNQYTSSRSTGQGAVDLSGPQGNHSNIHGYDQNTTPDTSGRPLQDCQVCQSTHANGLHFGARTCAACAAFFRRTISDGKKYVCKRSQRCNNPSRDGDVQHKRSRRDSPPVPKTFNSIFQPFYNHIQANGITSVTTSL